MITLLELTLIEKAGGPLTKSISLSGAGIKSDGSACVMTTGTASRLRLRDLGELAERIQRFQAKHALTLGVLRPDFPDPVAIVTRRALNGETRPGVVARTGENFLYRPGIASLEDERSGGRRNDRAAHRVLHRDGERLPVSAPPETIAISRLRI